MSATETTPDAAARSPSARTSEETLEQDAESVQRALELSGLRQQPPDNVPGYRILRPLGQGKYGSVWLAREQNTGKQVAVKFYTRRRGLDWSLLSREVEKLAVLYTSRHIVGLIEVGWDSDPPYYVMEYLDNGSLAGLLGRGPLPVAEAVRIVKGVLLGLVHAHGSGILHCDLKPANVLLDADAEPRLCDFGQSRLIDEQSPALGTLFYMAPEQADLKAVPDARWDVYALGALLYHMLCGEPPFRSPENEQRIREAGSLEAQLATYRNIMRRSPRPRAHRRVRGVDKRLAEIIDRCLQPDPAKRFANAQAVLDRLMARERARARRPLIALGVVVPLLIPLLIAPFAESAMHDAVVTTRRNVTARALESDVLSVNLLARNIEHDFLDRITELRRVAGDDEVRRLVAALATKPSHAERRPLWELLSKKTQAIQAERRAHGHGRDASWFLTDAQGVQRWREPYRPETMDNNFAHRDYFRAPDGSGPIRQPSISTAFQSDATRQYMIALSVPVWDADERQVIGVLARTLHLRDLLSDYGGELLDTEGEVPRTIALIDARNWKILAHPWLSRTGQLTPDAFEQLSLSGPVVEQLDRLTSKVLEGEELTGDDRSDDYRDPVGLVAPREFGGQWLAAFAPVTGTGWLAVVQERRDLALRPVEEMRSRIVRYGWSLLVLLGVVIGGCWFFVLRAMNEPRRPRRSRRGDWSHPADEMNSPGKGAVRV